MKRFILFFAVLCIAALPILAQTPAAPALPSFEAYLGAGQVATATSGDSASYKVDFQTNVYAGFRWFPTEKFALDATFTHDSVSIGEWLVRHNFAPVSTSTAYHYSTLAVSAEYWLLRNKSGGIYAFAGPQYFFSFGDQQGKLGLSAGFGAQYAIGHFFVETRAEYWHVQDYIVPVANVYVGRVGIGFKF